MFYLGSISGFLPYILAFSLTIVWGSHAGFPFFKTESVPESVSESSVEKNISVDQVKIFSYKSEISTENSIRFPSNFDTGNKVLNYYLFGIFDFAGIRIPLLRAPPISLF